jgi:hypothetical protein
VPDRLDRVPVVGEPAGGRGVQRGQFGRRAAAQLQLQEVGEQLVIAEPGPPRIQRDHERACLLQLLQDPLPARAPGQQVGQLAVHPLQHRGPQQQPPDRLALPVEHLGQQVLRHRPLAAGELGREPVRIAMPGQRQRRQPQPRRPALGPFVQQPERGIGQRYPGRLEQRPRLVPGEAQIGRPDLGELAFQPQPVQAQPQIMSGGEHEPQLRRRAHDQQLQLAQRFGRVQLVHVVDHQPGPILETAEIGQQPLDGRPAVQIGSRRQRPHQLRPGGRVPQGTEHREPEALRVALLALHRHPRGAVRQAALADPGVKQERLPLPAGADTSVTRPALPSSSNSPGRETTGPTAPSLTRPRPLPYVPQVRITRLCDACSPAGHEACCRPDPGASRSKV